MWAAEMSSPYAVAITITVYVFLGLSISALSTFGLFRMIVKESTALRKDSGGADGYSAQI
jgi:thiol:disulfide interchange protein